MRIGDVLLAHGWVDPATLTRAIAEQRYTQMRLCSLLIARGLLDFDNASRALSEQHGVPGALLKHLDGRDPFLAQRIPAVLGRNNRALPIGRMRDGKLIVAVCDPRPDLQHAIEQAASDQCVLAVTPATRLMELLLEAYGTGENDEFDVDLSTGPISIAQRGLESGLGALDAPQFTLAALDDERVSKDHTAHILPAKTNPGIMPARTATASQPPLTRSISDSVSPDAKTQAIPRASGRHSAVQLARIPPLTLDAVAARLETAGMRDEATDVATQWLEGRFTSSLIVTIKDGAALGHRGHGPNMQGVDMIALPMVSASMVKVVADTGKPTTDVPLSAIQERLSRLLGEPMAPAAAPIVLGGHVIGVIVVGDPHVGSPQEAFADLAWVAETLGTAYARILMDSKR